MNLLTYVKLSISKSNETWGGGIVKKSKKSQLNNGSFSSYEDPKRYNFNNCCTKHGQTGCPFPCGSGDLNHRKCQNLTGNLRQKVIKYLYLRQI